jgi:hypothetical protein
MDSTTTAMARDFGRPGYRDGAVSRENPPATTAKTTTA